MMTRETNESVFTRYGLRDPVEMLLQALAGSVHSYVGEFVSETFTCEVCGQMFLTQAALRAHNYKMHFDDATKQDRQQEVQQHKVQPTTSHAKQGLPWCRHCNLFLAAGRLYNTTSIPKVARHTGSHTSLQRTLSLTKTYH